MFVIHGLLNLMVGPHKMAGWGGEGREGVGGEGGGFLGEGGLAMVIMYSFGDGWGRLRVGAPFGSHLYKGFGSFCYVWIVV